MAAGALAAVVLAGVFVAVVVAVSFFVVPADLAGALAAVFVAVAVAFAAGAALLRVVVAVAALAVFARDDAARSSLTVSLVFVVDRVGMRTSSGEPLNPMSLGITKTHVKSLATPEASNREPDRVLNIDYRTVRETFIPPPAKGPACAGT